MTSNNEAQFLHFLFYETKYHIIHTEHVFALNKLTKNTLIKIKQSTIQNI